MNKTVNQVHLLLLWVKCVHVCVKGGGETGHFNQNICLKNVSFRRVNIAYPGIQIIPKLGQFYLIASNPPSHLIKFHPFYFLQDLWLCFLPHLHPHCLASECIASRWIIAPIPVGLLPPL